MNASQWILEYYDENGSCEIATWLDSLKESHRIKVLAWLNKLQEMGPLLPRPYADILRDGIHELRIKVGGGQYRVLYFFVFENNIVLTHPFLKNTKRVPDKEIEKAKGIREAYLSRRNSR